MKTEMKTEMRTDSRPEMKTEMKKFNTICSRPSSHLQISPRGKAELGVARQNSKKRRGQRVGCWMDV